MSGKLFFPTVCLVVLSLSACGEKSPPTGQAPVAPNSVDASSAPGQAASTNGSPSPYGGGYGGGGYGSYYSTGNITFLDDVSTNVDVGDAIASLSFTDLDGNVTRLQDYVGQKSVVLVITRGNTNPICPYCTTQTSRLIANYPKLAERNAEVIVVYPIEHNSDQDRLKSFLEASRKRLDDPSQPVPFPILLDVELKAVDQLGIRKDLSKPATYILDPEGHVRFAYVGADIADRPSVDAIIKQLDAFAPLNGEEQSNSE